MQLADHGETITRLEAEIERLNKEVAAWKQLNDMKDAENEQLRRDANTVIDKLVAEIKQLRAQRVEWP